MRITALTSAFCFGAAFPPAALWPLAWIALVPLLLAVRNAPSFRAVALASL
jgi:apolipoprotein N-acyltransferase